jgi:hypothetical protein
VGLVGPSLKSFMEKLAIRDGSGEPMVTPSIYSYEGWSECKFARCTLLQPKDIHLLWVCKKDLLIIVTNTVHQFTCPLPSIVCMSQVNVAI